MHKSGSLESLARVIRGVGPMDGASGDRRDAVADVLSSLAQALAGDAGERGRRLGFPYLR